jgi:hypothetical protein
MFQSKRKQATQIMSKRKTQNSSQSEGKSVVAIYYFKKEKKKCINCANIFLYFSVLFSLLLAHFIFA